MRDDEKLRVLGNLADVHLLQGRLDDALEGNREAILISREHDMPEALAWALGTSAELAEWRGEYAPAPYAEEVRRNAVEATEIAERLGVQPGSVYIRANNIPSAASLFRFGVS